jgi:hypothetical protein
MLRYWADAGARHEMPPAEALSGLAVNALALSRGARALGRGAGETAVGSSAG